MTQSTESGTQHTTNERHRKEAPRSSRAKRKPLGWSLKQKYFRYKLKYKLTKKHMSGTSAMLASCRTQTDKNKAENNVRQSAHFRSAAAVLTRRLHTYLLYVSANIHKPAHYSPTSSSQTKEKHTGPTTPTDLNIFMLLF